MKLDKINKAFNSINPSDETVATFFNKIESAINDIADLCPSVLDSFSVSAPSGSGYNSGDYCITIGNTYTYVFSDTNEEGKVGLAQYKISKSASGPFSQTALYVAKRENVGEAVNEISQTIYRSLLSQESTMPT